jgi:hypothetical protein
MLTPVTVNANGSFSIPFDFASVAIKGESNSSGEFLFEDLEPGAYILTMLDSSGMGTTMKDKQDEVIIIPVEAGQTVDLGEVLVK